MLLELAALLSALAKGVFAASLQLQFRNGSVLVVLP